MCLCVRVCMCGYYEVAFCGEFVAAKRLFDGAKPRRNTVATVSGLEARAVYA